MNSSHLNHTTEYRFTDANGRVFEIIKKPRGEKFLADTYSLYIDGELHDFFKTYNAAKAELTKLFGHYYPAGHVDNWSGDVG